MEAVTCSDTSIEEGDSRGDGGVAPSRAGFSPFTPLCSSSSFLAGPPLVSVPEAGGVTTVPLASW